MAPQTHQASSSIPIALRLPPRPRVLVVGHALKETLDVKLARSSLQLGTEIGGGTVTAGLCTTDGGDGFLDAFSDIHPGRRIRFLCADPLGQPVFAEFINHESSRTAIIELARSTGMKLVPPERRDIMRSSSAGLGEVIFHALVLGARDLHIGLGGSATCDGGIGMMMRLQQLVFGARRDRDHTAVDLSRPPKLMLPQMRERLRGLNIVVYCDVANPLLGREGTATVFAPQKGAKAGDVVQLEQGMAQWADEVERQGNESLRDQPGAGAAGGVGFALAALGARLKNGAEAYCKLLKLDEHLGRCDGVVTCEGKFDQTSFHGKAPYYVAKSAVDAGRRAVIACALADPSAAERALDEGIRIITFAEPTDPAQIPGAFVGLHQAATAFVRNHAGIAS
ncbi:glycerate kinase [Candidatus Sumerlaeota bacterium]|nr:glycerate kinase [Candidatus Sumerlaeota bacterium]